MSNAPPNKPLHQHYWNLKISMSTGFVANIDVNSSVDNSVWIDCNDTVQYQTYLGDVMLSHSGISLRILLDNNVIYSSDLDHVNTHKVSLDVLATPEHHHHKLQFEITGYQPDLHMPLMANHTEARPAIRIDSLQFENVDISQAFDTSSVFLFDDTQSCGDIIFGCTGTSKFEFSSPIYRWLINNKHVIARL